MPSAQRYEARREALAHAMILRDEGATSEEVVATAERFEAYLLRPDLVPQEGRRDSG